MTEEEKKLKKKQAQAVAHRKWRSGPKYAAYLARQKERKKAQT